MLNGTEPVLGQLQPFLENLNPMLQWLEYNQRLVGDFIGNGAGALVDTVPVRRPDIEIGHYLRQFGPIGPETVAIYPNRPSTNRGNAYLPPTAYCGPERAQQMIVPSFDCKNTKTPAATRRSCRPRTRTARATTRPAGRRRRRPTRPATRARSRTSARRTTPSRTADGLRGQTPQS